MRNGEYATWEELCVATPITSHPDYGLVVWGERNNAGEKQLSVSLRQNFSEETLGLNNELFCAYVPFDGSCEGLLNTVDKMLDHFDRSLRAPVEPLRVDYPYGHYSKDVMQPLLDVLNAGDFERAAALTPAKHRLCGYQEFAEDRLHEQYGHGWAGQFENTVVPAGRYPVFAREYSYNERCKHYENHLKDFQGLSVFLAGKCISDSCNRGADAYPFDNTVWESPYCHSVAKSILEEKASIHLIAPFQAMPVHFQYEGKDLITYKIVDMSLPERMKQNPMELRNQNVYIHKTMGLSENARKLYDAFVREFSFSSGNYGGNIPLNVLSRKDFYTSDALKELMDRDLVQRRNCVGVAYELTASERLDLFHSEQISFADSNSYSLKRVYDACKNEARQKVSLSAKIAAAEKRTVQAANTEKSKNRDPKIRK